MRLVLAAIVLAVFIIVLGCSTGPDPDRLKTPPQLTAADSCEDVQAIMDGMNNNTLWSPDLSFDEFLLVWDRDIDRIKGLYELYCPTAFRKCSDAARLSASYSPEFELPSNVIFFMLAEDFLESDCY